MVDSPAPAMTNPFQTEGTWLRCALHAHTTRSVAGLPAVVGIEVYNAGCEIECGRGLSTVHWDMLLDAGHSCFAVACDDTHYAGFDSGHAWTMVRATEPTPEGVVAALREGASYA